MCIRDRYKGGIDPDFAQSGAEIELSLEKIASRQAELEELKKEAEAEHIDIDEEPDIQVDIEVEDESEETESDSDEDGEPSEEAQEDTEDK